MPADDNSLTYALIRAGLPPAQATAVSALVGAGSAVSVVDNLSTSDASKALSAAQGVTLRAKKRWRGIGAPSDANLPGCTDGDTYTREDFPYQETVYVRSSGAWAVPDNTCLLANLPAPSAALRDIVLSVPDASQAAGQNVTQYLVCKTFDGGATYAWVPLNGRWRVYEENPDDNTTTGQVAGTGADLTVKTVNLPNSPYVWVPNMSIRLEAGLRNSATSLAASDTTSRTAHSYIKTGATTLFDQTLTQANSGTVVKVVDGEDSRVIRVLSSIANQRLLSAGAAGGFGSTSSGVPLALTLQNLPVSFIVNGPTTDSYKYFHRAIELVYPG